ncbi:MAG: secondary thiamine-phosphate synthase enzyme YjbQ [Anaerolineaceae bacterium]|nr:secondary thiamine-phosphate synthase enzyme YjbQ [Anaerolineaceae bacterium]
MNTFYLQLSAGGNADIQDITAKVEVEIRKSEIANGIVTVFCPSSTSAIATIEYENGCLNDFRRLFDEIIDPERTYAHNLRWGDGNGHSHVRAALLGPSLTVPFTERKLLLGTWQQIIFVDFDNRPRQRQLVLQVVGD